MLLRLKQIFTAEQEMALEKYLIRSAAMYYGLTLRATCKLAYEYAMKLRIRIPNNWKEKQSAGLEWLRSYRRRHSSLSLRKPQLTSIARATAFNAYNVRRFFDNLKSVMRRFGPFRLTVSTIWMRAVLQQCRTQRHE